MKKSYHSIIVPAHEAARTVRMERSDEREPVAAEVAVMRKVARSVGWAQLNGNCELQLLCEG
jgi:hypothetical protein